MKLSPELLADLRSKAEEAWKQENWDESSLRREWGESIAPPPTVLSLLDRIAELERIAKAVAGIPVDDLAESAYVSPEEAAELLAIIRKGRA